MENGIDIQNVCLYNLNIEQTFFCVAKRPKETASGADKRKEVEYENSGIDDII